jgi:hypothetical protein
MQLWHPSVSSREATLVISHLTVLAPVDNIYAVGVS